MGLYDDPVIAAASNKSMNAMVFNRRFISQQAFDAAPHFPSQAKMVKGEMYKWIVENTVIVMVDDGMYEFHNVET